MVEKVAFSRDGLVVRGYLVFPKTGTAPYPLVVVSHGFGSNGRRVLTLAEELAEAGVAACAYSFCGAFEGDSDGSTLDRSILTEAADLQAVLHGLAARPDIDEARVGLLGMSEGGCVSTLVAAECPEVVRALALMYPAFCIPDDARRLVAANGGVVPETMDVMGRTIGGVYLRDAMVCDPFAGMPEYAGPVLIVHGTADEIVPIEYSRRAAKTFPNARLIEIEGAGHGMRQEQGPEMAHQAVEFITGKMLAR